MMPVIAKTAPATNPAMSAAAFTFSSSTFAVKTSISEDKNNCIQRRRILRTADES